MLYLFTISFAVFLANVFLCLAIAALFVVVVYALISFVLAVAPYIDGSK